MSDKKFWTIWTPKGRTLSFQHETEKAARDEAARLARENVGSIFYVMEAIAKVEAIYFLWTELVAEKPDDIPF